MKPSKKRVTTGSRESLTHKKSNPNVPEELGVILYLPGIGSVLDYEWFVVEQPVAIAATSATPVISQRPCLDPRELDRLCSDPAALREFLAEKQQQIVAFEPWRKKRPFAECSGALSGGAL
jgi:hypothetical protein